MHLTSTPAPQTGETARAGAPAEPAGERQPAFTSSQAARYLGVSLATIRRWADAGYLSCYRTPGSQRRFSRRQLDDFIASMQRPGHGDGYDRRAA
jgi:excisionase family DNA binding protein